MECSASTVSCWSTARVCLYITSAAVNNGDKTQRIGHSLLFCICVLWRGPFIRGPAKFPQSDEISGTRALRVLKRDIEHWSAKTLKRQDVRSAVSIPLHKDLLNTTTGPEATVLHHLQSRRLFERLHLLFFISSQSSGSVSGSFSPQLIRPLQSLPLTSLPSGISPYPLRSANA
jgi:hypothetical protein